VLLCEFKCVKCRQNYMHKVWMTAVPMKWKSFKLSKDFHSLGFVKIQHRQCLGNVRFIRKQAVIHCATTVIHLTCYTFCCLYLTAGNEVVSLPVKRPGHGPFLVYSISVIQFNNWTNTWLTASVIKCFSARTIPPQQGKLLLLLWLLHTLQCH